VMIGTYNFQLSAVWTEVGLCATSSRWRVVVAPPSRVQLRLDFDVSNAPLLVVLEYPRLMCVCALLTLTDYAHLCTLHVQSPP